MINLTDSALNAVRNAISAANKPVDGLRIMVEAGGCAGYKYNLGLVDEIDPDDTVIERDGVRVFVDNEEPRIPGRHHHRLRGGARGIGLHLRKSQRESELRLRKVVRLSAAARFAVALLDRSSLKFPMERSLEPCWLKSEIVEAIADHADDERTARSSRR